MPGRRRSWEVRESGVHGKGVFATRTIRAGTWIIEYAGERITHDEADLRYDDDAPGEHHTFLFAVDDTWCIDAARGGNEARFINHSCDPNCEAVHEVETGRIWICAIRTIRPGEELTYDYGFKPDGEDLETARRKYPCRCGAANCRGTILSLEGLSS